MSNKRERTASSVVKEPKSKKEHQSYNCRDEMYFHLIWSFISGLCGVVPCALALGVLPANILGVGFRNFQTGRPLSQPLGSDLKMEYVFIIAQHLVL